MNKPPVYDIAGIGIGPFNLGLAALLEPVSGLSAVFFDQAECFDWHPGLLLNNATLQVPFMADLVTMANPASPYSLVNFLKEKDRLYPFYIRESFFVLRKEYNAYCQWVAAQLASCRFAHRVSGVQYNSSTGLYEIAVVHRSHTAMYHARKLVLGTGTQPYVPEFAKPSAMPGVIHSSQYLSEKENMLKQASVTVIGSGQSAAEVFYDLLPHTQQGLQLNWFSRADRFFPMEYAKLTLELTSPEYVDYFHSLPPEKRKAVLHRQNPLFKGINYDLINDIFDTLYEMSAGGETLRVQLRPDMQLDTITAAAGGGYELHLTHMQQQRSLVSHTAAVILCTGYKYREPAFLQGIQQRIARFENGDYQVQRNYAIDHTGNEIFVQNAELHTHGFVTPDLGMGAYRNSCIINAIAGKEMYKTEKRIAFQQFGLEENNNTHMNHTPSPATAAAAQPAVAQPASLPGKTVWEKVNLNYICKSIAELMHEQMLLPMVTQTTGEGITHFRLNTDNVAVYYTFAAELRVLDYWHIHKNTLQKHFYGDIIAAADAPGFFIELQQTLGVRPFTLTHFVEETLNTLHADAYIHGKGRLTAAQLADADYQTIEHQMDGHPWATVNKGRIGFNQADHAAYTPEASKPTQLSWIAVHHKRAAFHSLNSIRQQAFYEKELGANTLARFQQVLSGKGLSPADYLLMPVHEWQWNNKIVFQFAHDIAHDLLVPLGRGEDRYMCQQSIRTFFNTSHPEKHYVKTAISILNTSVYRGLSPKKLAIAPRVTQWVRDMLAGDTYLQQTGVVLLGEVATVGYAHPHYSAITQSPYQYQELLGVIWRESAEHYLQPGENIMTMASLLYVDDAGNSFVAELIQRSGLTPAAWLRAYLEAYFKPILRIFYGHAFFFSPHGENTILVMKNYTPHRIIIKDFVEEIVLTPEAKTKLPADLTDVLREIDEAHALLFILSGVFDAVFRYLSNVFHTYVGYPENEFWQQVAEIITGFQEAHPELADKFERYNLFVPEFIRVCINRVRLLTYGYSEATDIPVPEISGTLVNPVAAAREAEMA